MPYPTDVKIYRYTDGGAPELKGAAGYLSSLLHACLVTGYNVKTPTSVSRSGSEVTVTYSAAHGYVLDQVIRLAGANEAGYNGDFRITWIDTASLKFVLASGVTPATPATGTIETRVAPAGWERSFSDTNKAVFKPVDPAATGCYLRIDDTNLATRRAVVRGYISMTDINTGTEPFPASQSFYWHKSTDDATARSWFVAADSRLFYIGMNGGGTSWADLHAFGDIVTYKPGDAYHCMLSGSGSATVDTASSADPLATKVMTPWQFGTGLVVARNYGGVPVSSARLSLMGAVTMAIDGVTTGARFNPIGASGLLYPHIVDNGIIVGSLYYSEETGTNGAIRGYPPGLYDPWNSIASTIGNIVVMNDLPVVGRKILMYCIRGSTAASSLGSMYNANGNAMIDIIGPWRSA